MPAPGNAQNLKKFPSPLRLIKSSVPFGISSWSEIGEFFRLTRAWMRVTFTAQPILLLGYFFPLDLWPWSDVAPGMRIRWMDSSPLDRPPTGNPNWD